MFDIYSTFNRNSNTEAVSSVLYGKKKHICTIREEDGVTFLIN